MKREWCPKCQALQDMNTTKAENSEKDKGGKNIKVITESYQCSVCHMFIKSEIYSPAIKE